MYSSEELKKRILSKLEVKEAEENSPKETTCPFDCSPEFSMLHELGEDVDRLDSSVTTLGIELWKIRGHAITDLSSRYQNLQSDHQRVKGEVERLKEIVGTHGERLDEVDKKLETLYTLRPIVDENKAKIAKLEEHTNDLGARLDDEKQQRKESESNLWLVIGLAFLWLLSRQRLAETQIAPPPTPPALVVARAYLEAKKFRR